MNYKIKEELKKIKSILLYIRDFPKTVYMNFKVFPFDVAKKLPIRVCWNVKLKILSRNCIQIKSYISNGMIRIGYSGTPFIPKQKSYIYMGKNSKLVFKGKCNFAEGINLYINNGELEIGDGVYINRNVQIQCEKNITIGNNSLIGWNVNIRDTDGHIVLCDGEKKSEKEKIIIKSNVWLASDTTILKGSVIANGSIVACNSVVAGYRLEEDNCLLAGIPADLKKKNIQWIE